MPNFIGLYYPHFTFPSDAWIKLAVLYWDKLGRILPPLYQPDDSDTVQRLRGELDFTEDFAPSYRDKAMVSKMFVEMLDQYGQQLLLRYSVLPDKSHLGYVYSDIKMSAILAYQLKAMGLAVDLPPDHRSQDSIIGLHPKLALIYMEALANQMASDRQLNPITNNVRDHIAIGEYTLERLVQALLPEDEVTPHLVGITPTHEEITRQIATIALQSILPKNLADIPVEKFIQLRKKHRTELTTFQTYIHDFTANLSTIQQIEDPRAINAHLKTVYEREIRPQIDNLRKCMQSFAIETITGILNVKVALPPFLASAGAALHLAPISPQVAGTIAIVGGIFSVYQSKRTTLYNTVQASPAAYLLYAQEGLTPTDTISQVVQTTRHMLLGV